jgi:hypothetical protein
MLVSDFASSPNNVLRVQQLQFANYLRDPLQYAAPGDVESRRMLLYRELFFNNIRGLLAGMFPVIHSILSEDDWQALVQDFFSLHSSATPLFPFIGEEFVRYLQHERQAPGDVPFLQELAHYEYADIALRNSDEDVLPQQWCGKAVGDDALLQSRLALSPLCWPLVYRYPVHRIGKSWQPQEKPETQTFLLLCRNRRDEVRFVESNAATFRLLQCLQAEEGWPLDRVITQLAKEMPQTENSVLRRGVLDTALQLLNADILLLPLAEA